MKALFLFTASLLLPSAGALAQEPVFDTHVHLHKGEQSIQDYEAQLKAGNVEVNGYAAMWFGGPNQALLGEAERVRKSHDELIALAAKHPKMMPVATVHPYEGQAAIAELERVARLGFKILKIHPHTQKFDAADPRVLALVKKAGELGIIVLMDNANIVPSDNEKLFNLALQAPKTKFIYAHLGGLSFRFWNILKLARTAENLFANNVYFDISATVLLAANSPIEDEFVWTMRNVGIDQLLVGSDFPQLSLAQTLEALNQLGLDKDEIAKIRYENARKLFVLGTPAKTR